MARDGYSKGSPSDSDLLHGAGQGGGVLHSGSRHPDIVQATTKGPDAGMSASLGRPRASSDMSGDSPQDHVVAPGQRTVTAPKGAPSPVKVY
jgi:hypothetical protein